MHAISFMARTDSTISFDFNGKTVLITGGSTGIGHATALAFARQGANVVIGDKKEDEAKQTVDEIKQAGGEALFVKTDVSNEEDVKRLVETTVNTYGSLDFAFNNAGIAPENARLHEINQESFDRIINVDLKGVFLCIKHELLHMRRVGKGAIVNTSSVAGLLPEPEIGSYVAAKHGVIGLTKVAALENAELGIRVNSVAPGWVRTPMTEDWEKDQKLNERLRSETPMHRPAEPEEIAGIVLFLCSDLASYITGQTYPVEGGQTIRGLLPVESKSPEKKAA